MTRAGARIPSILVVVLLAAVATAHTAHTAHAAHVGSQAAEGAAPVTATAAGPDPAAVAALRSELAGVVAPPETAPDRWSILAVSLDRGDTLFSRDAATPLAPASNMKLFTTAAALEHLGAEHRFTTYLMADGPIRDGVIEGNLYLYGTGDPRLGVRFSQGPALQLRAFADTLEAMGVRAIRGDIIGDGSYFEGPGTGPGWQPEYMNAWYATPAGALSVHENLVRVTVSPGQPGGPPELSFDPGGNGVAVYNEAVTGGGGRVTVVRSGYEGPILVRGRISGGTTARAVPVGDPAMYAAALFADILTDREILVQGAVREITAAEASPVTGRRVFAPSVEPEQGRLRVLAIHVSEPLAEVLHLINHRSQNFYSEQVLRAVGRAAFGVGSGEAGGRAVEQVLARAGVDTSGVRVADGCGLSPLNTASARDFVALLAHMARSPHAEAFLNTLPVAGETPRFRRMGGTPAGGNLRAKTGTIQGVSALSGYVTAANGERIAFSIIGNDLRSVAGGKHIENQIGIRLASFDRTGAVTSPLDPGVAED